MASRRGAKASGTPASMVARNAAYGARSTSGSMNRRSRSAPSKSPVAMSAMRRCCPSCWIRSRQMRKSRQSPRTEHTTRASATTRSQIEAHVPSYLPAKNAKPWKPSTAGAIARNEALRAAKYLGRAIWRRWSGYHRRSRAETKMHCVKLLGQSLMARDFDRQVAELQVRAAVLNGYTSLGIPVTEPMG